MTRNRLLLLLVPAVVLTASIVSGTAVMSEKSESTACACTTVGSGDQSNPANVLVVVNGSDSGVSISQQSVQSDGQTRIDIDVEFDDVSIAISGETAANGSLVFEVTRDGTVVNESVVFDGPENQTLVFHLDGDGHVRITRNTNVACDVRSNDVTGNVETGGVGVNVNGDSVDATDGFGCSESVSCTCSNTSTELSPPIRRPSASLGTPVDSMRAIVRPNALVGLAMANRPGDCDGGGTTTDCPFEP